MSLFVLDTDTLTLLQQGDPNVTARVNTHSQEDLAITVITVEEQLSGWYDLLRRASTNSARAEVYRRLAEAVRLLGGFPMLLYTEADMARYNQLRGMKLNVGGYDLRIAAIALENNATVVTRNLRDCSRVPNLTVEGWFQ